MLKINYNTLLGDWVPYLQEPILDKVYMKSLMSFLHEEYKKRPVLPDKKDLFKTFIATPYSTVRVVIIGNNPYPNIKGTGIPLANEFEKSGTTLSPELNKVRECIEKNVYDGLDLNFDPTLEKWTDQGILMLNSALTTVQGNIKAHQGQWSKFIELLLKVLSANKAGICYLLLGPEAQEFKRYINQANNHVFEYKHPSYSVKHKEEWNCPYFNEINNVIKFQNGKEFCIDW